MTAHVQIPEREAGQELLHISARVNILISWLKSLLLWSLTILVSL